MAKKHTGEGIRPYVKYVDGLEGQTAKLKAAGCEGAGNEEGLINQELVPQLDCAYQKPQGREDRQAVNYDNDSDGWVRGRGPNAPYPHFDKHKSGSK
jgi:hypothetical protein